MIKKVKVLAKKVMGWIFYEDPPDGQGIPCWARITDVHTGASRWVANQHWNPYESWKDFGQFFEVAQAKYWLSISNDLRHKGRMWRVNCDVDLVGYVDQAPEDGGDFKNAFCDAVYNLVKGQE